MNIKKILTALTLSAFTVTAMAAPKPHTETHTPPPVKTVKTNKKQQKAAPKKQVKKTVAKKSVAKKQVRKVGPKHHVRPQR